MDFEALLGFRSTSGCSMTGIGDLAMFKAIAIATAFLSCIAVCETRAKAPETLASQGATGPLLLPGEINVAASTAPRGRSSSPEEHESVPREEPSKATPKNGGAPKGATPKLVKALDAVEIGSVLLTISGIVLFVTASAVALLYSRRRDHDVADDESLIESTQSISSSPPSTPESDIVDVSAFAPPIGKAEEEVFVQIFFHKLDQTAVVEAQAGMIDPSASIRSKATLNTEILRGERIDIVLEGPSDLKIDEAHQFLIWRGEPRSCQFIVTLPSVLEGRRTIHLRARLLLAGVPIGALRFPMVVSAYEESTPLELVEQTAERNRRAFLSYASTDRAEVLKRMQALKVAHIECFQDFIDLEPGERWERRLYEEIDRCDLFVLFWSAAAAKSLWVAREAEYALKRQKLQGESVIDITPIILEGPPIPAPPEILKEIQFNDAIRYLIAAIETETNAAHIDQRRQHKKRAKISPNAKVGESPKGSATVPKWITAVKQFAGDWMV